MRKRRKLTTMWTTHVPYQSLSQTTLTCSLSSPMSIDGGLADDELILSIPPPPIWPFSRNSSGSEECFWHKYYLQSIMFNHQYVYQSYPFHLWLNLFLVLLFQDLAWYCFLCLLILCQSFCFPWCRIFHQRGLQRSTLKSRQFRPSGLPRIAEESLQMGQKLGCFNIFKKLSYNIWLDITNSVKTKYYSSPNFT